jgi:hypothetical protein
VKSAVGREMSSVAEKPCVRVGGMPRGIRGSRVADGKFAAYFMQLSCLTYSSNLKMETIYYFEMSVISRLRCVTCQKIGHLSVHTSCEAHPTSYPTGTGGFSPGLKRSGREADNSI